MYSHAFSFLFIAFLTSSLLVRFWLASRQIRHVLQHRHAVPADFAEKISLMAHQKAAAYTVARTKLGLVDLMFSAIMLVCFTLLGGLQWLSVTIFKLTDGGMVYQLGLLASFALITSILDLPLSYYRQFVLEQRFGFNRMGKGLFFQDFAKELGLSLALMLPLAWIVLELMAKAGTLWWLYAWGAIAAYNLLIQAIAPTVIMPLFNKFTPLADEALTARINGLAQRVSFASRGLFVMDGSKRSTKSNAYFSGFGRTKRIVFYDTLIERLAPQEIEAVLAHELGHFKLKHVAKGLAIMLALLLPMLALLGYLKTQLWFYTGLGVNPIIVPGQSNDALALLLFLLTLPIFTFLFAPLFSIGSRKHEFEADAFAVKHTNSRDLVSALVKMFDDNASTLTPDPLHSAFYDSHPPASVRIRQLNLAASQ
ncbi:M48 family metallopeptidase [Duganella sp. Root1480D1]|uniref:M48 family metallopeptidase n=1 Tax=Duganella sp. Root1480D1 TaxID=1736471 RepID=UPI00070F9DD0|nr:M48 family metallopeptidase [Duganella sp. Root1480D1]KQZ30517.1 peptidase M48 [Duganella sp. Root1480D1]